MPVTSERVRTEGWGVALIGPSRARTQDQLLCRNDLGLFVVAEGVSRQLGGDQASRLAVDTMARCVSAAHASQAGARATPDAPSTGLQLLRRAIVEANRTVHDAARAMRLQGGMGTTLTALYFAGRIAYVGHLGNARAYALREDTVRLLTRNHSDLDDETPSRDRDRIGDETRPNVLPGCLGFRPHVQPIMSRVPVLPGDRFLLCSAGVWSIVPEADMAALRRAACSFVPHLLVQLARDGGGTADAICVAVETSPVA